MKPVSFIKYQMCQFVGRVHSSRVKAVFDVVEGVINGSSLCLSCIGRALSGKISPKHCIKKVDRLFGNKHLHSEVPLFAAAQAQALLVTLPTPVLLVDWTPTGSEEIEVLTVAIALNGRALALYSEAHRLGKGQRTKIETAFLWVLKELIIPAGCRPIIVTDTGFKNPWFNVVRDLDWDYVGRIGSSTHVQDISNACMDPDEEQWIGAKLLMETATNQPTDLGRWNVAKTNPMDCRLILYKKLPKRKKQKTSRKPNRKGVHPGSDVYKKCVKRAKTPWLLATSLEDWSAQQVVNLYGLRMQIEETFRDAKSHRFGWSMEDVRTESTERMSIILMVASISMLIAITVGMAAEQRNLHKQIQANTVTTRRVLSLFFVGNHILRNGHLRRRLRSKALRQATEQICDIITRNGESHG